MCIEESMRNEVGIMIIVTWRFARPIVDRLTTCARKVPADDSGSGLGSLTAAAVAKP